MIMTRREFITGLGGSVVSWPLYARAQSASVGKRRIGLLMQTRRQEILLSGLRELGYVEGENIAIEARSNDRTDRLAAFAAELVNSKPDVIVTSGTQAAQAARRATQTIPIVMAGSSDPVGTGLIVSLARPGGNITGFSFFSPELSGKRLELLREIIGGVTSLGVLWKPDDPPAAIALKETQLAAKAIGLALIVAEARNAEDLRPAFEGIAKRRPDALVVLTAPLMSIEAPHIAALALGLKLPAIYSDAAFPEAGGFMSYGPNFDDITRRAALYVDKILKGAKPADLPVEQPTKFELVLNLKTAKAVGVEVSPNFLARADHVIE
jgi:putative ABC transport system substrate-binding protein